MLYEDFISGKLDASNHRHDLGSHATQPSLSSSSSKAGKVENITQIMWPSLYLGKPLEQSPLHQKAQSMAKALLGADMAFDFDMLISKVRYNGLHIRQTTGSFRSWVNTNIRIILDPSVRASHLSLKITKIIFHGKYWKNFRPYVTEIGFPYYAKVERFHPRMLNAVKWGSQKSVKRKCTKLNLQNIKSSLVRKELKM